MSKQYVQTKIGFDDGRTAYITTVLGPEGIGVSVTGLCHVRSVDTDHWSFLAPELDEKRAR